MLNLLLLGITWYSWSEWDFLEKLGLEVDVFTVASGNLLQSFEFWRAMFFVFGILALVVVVVTIFMFKRIRIAVTILEEATRV